MLRDSPKDERVKQDVNHIPGLNLPGNQDSQAFPGVFIDDVQYLEGSTISRAIYHEIIAPDMVLILWPEPDTGAVIEP